MSFISLFIQKMGIVPDVKNVENHLTYKVDNFNSEGKYPNITPPIPQPVSPGSGYPLV